VNYRYLLGAAIGIPCLYAVIWVLGQGMHLLGAAFDFLTSVQSDADAFAVVSFLLAVVSAAVVIPVYRELVQDGPWRLDSWSDFLALLKVNLPWYGLAIVGAASGGLALYLFVTPHAPLGVGFGLFANYCAAMAGALCLVSMLVDTGRSLWLLARDGGWAVRS